MLDSLSRTLARALARTLGRTLSPSCPPPSAPRRYGDSGLQNQFYTTYQGDGMVSGPGHGNVEKAREVAEKQRADAVAAAAEETRLRIDKFGADCERIVCLEWVELGSNSLECTCRFTRDLVQGDQLKLPTQLKEGETVPVLLILPGERGPILQRAVAHQAAYEAMIASPSWVRTTGGRSCSQIGLIYRTVLHSLFVPTSCYCPHVPALTPRHTTSSSDHLVPRRCAPLTMKSAPGGVQGQVTGVSHLQLHRRTISWHCRAKA